MSEVESGSSSPAGRRWLRITLRLCAVLLVILCALPIALRYGGEYWLNEQPNMSASIGDIDLNLFSGTIKVEEIELWHLNEQVLFAEIMVLKIDWLPLLQRRFYVEQITLEEGALWLTQAQDKSVMVAGFSLAKESDQPIPVLEQTPQAESAKWGVHSGAIALKNVQLHYRAPHVDMDVVVNQLEVDPFSSWRPDVLSPFRADIIVNGGKLNFDGMLSPFSAKTVVDGSLRLSAFELKTVTLLLEQMGVSEASGQLDCALHVCVKKAADEAQTLQLDLDGELNATAFRGGAVPLYVHRFNGLWSGGVKCEFSSSPQFTVDGKLTFADVDLDLLASGLKIEQKQLAWQGTAGLRGAALSLAGDLSLTGSAIEDLAKQRQLLELTQLDLKGLDIAGVEKISSDRLELEGLHVFARGQSADSSHSVTISQTSLENLALSELNQLHVKTVHLAGVNVALNRTVSGALDVQEWFPPAPSVADETETDAGSVASESPLVIQCDEITIDQGSQVRIVDSTLEPPLPVVVKNIALKINHLNSAKPQQSIPLTFSATVGRYSKLAVNGHIKPFMQPIGLELAGSLREFDVATMSPYSEKNIGYQLQQGHLNLDFNLPIADGLMALDSDIYLRQIRLQALSAEAEANASKGIGLPVNLALSLLRNRDGDIHLQVPVHGDLNDPNIHVGPILRSAVLHTLHNTVMLPLAPLGIVSKVGEVIGIGNALSFDRVAFEAGTAVMAPSARTYLDNVAKLLGERSQLSVAVCGRFTEQDHQIFMLAEKNEDVLQQSSRELAEARAVAVKEQLLRSGHVEGAQLLLCRPMATVVSGVAGVDLTLQ